MEGSLVISWMAFCADSICSTSVICTFKEQKDLNYTVCSAMLLVSQNQARRLRLGV